MCRFLSLSCPSSARSYVRSMSTMERRSNPSLCILMAIQLHYHVTLYSRCQLFLMPMMAMTMAMATGRTVCTHQFRTGWKRNYFLFQHFSLVSNLIPGSEMKRDDEWMNEWAWWVDDMNYQWNISTLSTAISKVIIHVSFSWHERVCRRHLSPAHKKSSMKICGIW